MHKHEWLTITIGPYDIRFCKSCTDREMNPNEEGSTVDHIGTRGIGESTDAEVDTNS